MTKKEKVDLIAWYRINAMSLRCESRACYREGNKEDGLYFSERSSEYTALANQLEANL